jgi:hypothetical protein
VPITEETRYRLYQRLEAVLGSEEASILMEHLPPAGWADVATKQDLQLLKLDVRSEIRGEINKLLYAILASNTALLVGAFTAARLL